MRSKKGKKTMPSSKIMHPFKLCIGKRNGKKYQFDKLAIGSQNELMTLVTQAVTGGKARGVHEVLIVIR